MALISERPAMAFTYREITLQDRLRELAALNKKRLIPNKANK